MLQYEVEITKKKSYYLLGHEEKVTEKGAVETQRRKSRHTLACTVKK